MNTNTTFGERFGRLGNQLFQIALLYAIRHRRGHQFFLPHDGESVWDCFDIDVAGAGPECGHVFEETNGSCNYDARVFEQPDGTAFRGYFQSYRYLEGCEESLRRFLRFNEPHKALAEARLFALRRAHGRPLVSVHVRRRDYVDPRYEDLWGNLAADGFYERAIAEIGDDAAYLVFSDDLDWCRAHFDMPHIEFIDHDHSTSLCMMTRCDVSVVANSSFSWWGAYLNRAADVYAPSRWFGPAKGPPNDRQADIVPPAWRVIPTFVDVT